MKGQFFILGAVLICILFYIGMPLYAPSINSQKGDISLASSNIASEFPKALNLGVKEGAGPGSLVDFSQFARSRLLEQSMGFRALWVVAEPESSMVRITAGNFMGSQEVVNVTAGGSQQSFVLDDGTYQSALLPLSGNYQIRIEYSGRSWDGTWQADKVSLYSFIETSRGGDIAVQETEA